MTLYELEELILENEFGYFPDGKEVEALIQMNEALSRFSKESEVITATREEVERIVIKISGRGKQKIEGNALIFKDKDGGLYGTIKVVSRFIIIKNKEDGRKTERKERSS